MDSFKDVLDGKMSAYSLRSEFLKNSETQGVVDNNRRSNEASICLENDALETGQLVDMSNECYDAVNPVEDHSSMNGMSVLSSGDFGRKILISGKSNESVLQNSIDELFLNSRNAETTTESSNFSSLEPSSCPLMTERLSHVPGIIYQETIIRPTYFPAFTKCTAESSESSDENTNSTATNGFAGDSYYGDSFSASRRDLQRPISAEKDPRSDRHFRVDYYTKPPHNHQCGVMQAQFDDRLVKVADRSLYSAAGYALHAPTTPSPFAGRKTIETPVNAKIDCWNFDEREGKTHCVPFDRLQIKEISEHKRRCNDDLGNLTESSQTIVQNSRYKRAQRDTGKPKHTGDYSKKLDEMELCEQSVEMHVQKTSILKHNMSRESTNKSILRKIRLNQQNYSDGLSTAKNSMGDFRLPTGNGRMLRAETLNERRMEALSEVKSVPADGFPDDDNDDGMILPLTRPGVDKTFVASASAAATARARNTSEPVSPKVDELISRTSAGKLIESNEDSCKTIKRDVSTLEETGKTGDTNECVSFVRREKRSDESEHLNSSSSDYSYEMLIMDSARDVYYYEPEGLSLDFSTASLDKNFHNILKEEVPFQEDVLLQIPDRNRVVGKLQECYGQMHKDKQCYLEIPKTNRKVQTLDDVTAQVISSTISNGVVHWMHKKTRLQESINEVWLKKINGDAIGRDATRPNCVHDPISIETDKREPRSRIAEKNDEIPCENSNEKEESRKKIERGKIEERSQNVSKNSKKKGNKEKKCLKYGNSKDSIKQTQDESTKIREGERMSAVSILEREKDSNNRQIDKNGVMATDVSEGGFTITTIEAAAAATAKDEDDARKINSNLTDALPGEVYYHQKYDNMYDECDQENNKTFLESCKENIDEEAQDKVKTPIKRDDNDREFKEKELCKEKDDTNMSNHDNYIIETSSHRYHDMSRKDRDNFHVIYKENQLGEESRNETEKSQSELKRNKHEKEKFADHAVDENGETGETEPFVRNQMNATDGEILDITTKRSNRQRDSEITNEERKNSEDENKEGQHLIESRELNLGLSNDTVSEENSPENTWHIRNETTTIAGRGPMSQQNNEDGKFVDEMKRETNGKSNRETEMELILAFRNKVEIIENETEGERQRRKCEETEKKPKAYQQLNNERQVPNTDKTKMKTITDTRITKTMKSRDKKKTITQCDKDKIESEANRFSDGVQNSHDAEEENTETSRTQKAKSATATVETTGFCQNVKQTGGAQMTAENPGNALNPEEHKVTASNAIAGSFASVTPLTTSESVPRGNVQEKLIDDKHTENRKHGKTRKDNREDKKDTGTVFSSSLNTTSAADMNQKNEEGRTRNSEKKHESKCKTNDNIQMTIKQLDSGIEENEDYIVDDQLTTRVEATEDNEYRDGIIIRDSSSDSKHTNHGDDIRTANGQTERRQNEQKTVSERTQADKAAQTAIKSNTSSRRPANRCNRCKRLLLHLLLFALAVLLLNSTSIFPTLNYPFDSPPI